MTDHVEFMPVKIGQYPLPRPASPSPTWRQKISARPFHNTGMLARQTGVTLAAVEPAGRELRGLALRGSPLGTRSACQREDLKREHEEHCGTERYQRASGQ